MKKINGNYIRVTILKIKQCIENVLSYFTLNIEFNNQNCETDKLTGKDIDLGKV